MMKLETHKTRRKTYTRPKNRNRRLLIVSLAKGAQRHRRSSTLCEQSRHNEKVFCLFMVMSHQGWCCKVKPAVLTSFIFMALLSLVDYRLYSVLPMTEFVREERRLHSIKDLVWQLTSFFKGTKFHNIGLYTPINYKKKERQCPDKLDVVRLRRHCNSNFNVVPYWSLPRSCVI